MDSSPPYFFDPFRVVGPVVWCCFPLEAIPPTFRSVPGPPFLRNYSRGIFGSFLFNLGPWKWLLRLESKPGPGEWHRGMTLHLTLALLPFLPFSVSSFRIYLHPNPTGILCFSAFMMILFSDFSWYTPEVPHKKEWIGFEYFLYKSTKTVSQSFEKPQIFLFRAIQHRIFPQMYWHLVSRIWIKSIFS